MKYVLAIDQSTQGTKVLIVDMNGKILSRCSKPHMQIIDENGYISHDVEEIYSNLISLIPVAVEQAGIDKKDIVTVGISNQRETTVLFNEDGALAPAVVWQCARGKDIAAQLQCYAEEIRSVTGLPLSPYFPAAKMAWLLKHEKPKGRYMLGTIDTWLIYKLTGKFLTDYSNASRTQLFDIHTLSWSKRMCGLFGIPETALAEVTDSDGEFGQTTFEGFLPSPIPVRAVLGDSHAALYAHGCFKKGDVKATYGTGSSVMMNVGDECIKSTHGLSVSLAWKTEGKVNYILEGNINYSAALVTWLKDDLGVIHNLDEIPDLAKNSHPNDKTVLVPAFSGLSAPYWNPSATACLVGMTRTTGRGEIVRAALDSIALQINDVLNAMMLDSGIKVNALNADGGATGNDYLMQVQSDISDCQVEVSSLCEFSALGVACLSGKGYGLKMVQDDYKVYKRRMSDRLRNMRLSDWRNALAVSQNK